VFSCGPDIPSGTTCPEKLFHFSTHQTRYVFLAGNLPKCSSSPTKKLCSHSSLKANYNIPKEKNPHASWESQETCALDQERKLK
jgi:hypothetical protein